MKSWTKQQGIMELKEKDKQWEVNLAFGLLFPELLLTDRYEGSKTAVQGH